MILLDLIADAARQLEDAGVAFGHGTDNAHDEAAWLVLWALGLPLDTPLTDEDVEGDLPDDLALSLGGTAAVPPQGQRVITGNEQAQVQALLAQRIATRKPAAYLTQEAWLQGVPFYVDERAIVPRSFIAELLADGSIDAWLSDQTHHVLDLCTGNGSLAVLAAMVYPDVQVTGADLSPDALAVAQINVVRHGLSERIALRLSDGLSALEAPPLGVYDLILCNPPYVNAASMAALPPEYQAEPELALAGGTDGMDFVRQLLRDAPTHLSEHAVLVLEIGNERPYFDRAFADLEVVWLPTSAGDDQVLLITRTALHHWLATHSAPTP